MKRERYRLIDALRGVSLLNMLAFHLLYDIFVVYASAPDWAARPEIITWERFICVPFVLISGVSLNFSRHAYRRGLIVNLCGLLITAVTAIFVPDQIIIFGVLNLIGCSMWITQALRRLFEKCNPFAGAAASFLLFAFFYGLTRGFLGFLDIPLVDVPDFFYAFPPLAVVGLPARGFFSTDYFPLLPWLFLYFCGFFLWRAILRLNLDRWFKLHIPVLDFIGKYTLWIYMIHQPILMGVCFLIFGKI